MNISYRTDVLLSSEKLSTGYKVRVMTKVRCQRSAVGSQRSVISHQRLAVSLWRTAGREARDCPKLDANAVLLEGGLEELLQEVVECTEGAECSLLRITLVLRATDSYRVQRIQECSCP